MSAFLCLPSWRLRIKRRDNEDNDNENDNVKLISFIPQRKPPGSSFGQQNAAISIP